MDVQRGKTPTVRLVPDVPMSAPTAAVYDADGSLLASPNATPSTVNTTVAEDADNTQQVLKLASATGVERGLTVRVTDASFGTADAVVSAIDGVYCHLVQPLPAIPDTGSSVRGLDVSVELPEEATDELGLGRRLEVVEGNARATLVFNVVAYPFEGPCSAMHVREVLARRQSSVRLDEELLARIADEVNAEIRARLMASRAFLSAYWDPKAVSRIRRPVINLILGEEHGIWDANIDRERYVERQERLISIRLGDLLKSAEAYDQDMDGELTDEEQAGVTVTRLQR